MNGDWTLSNTSAADLLQSSPKAVRFFMEQKTNCASCLLARFCTLQDVIKAYQLDEEIFLAELAQITVQNQK